MIALSTDGNLRWQMEIGSALTEKGKMTMTTDEFSEWLADEMERTHMSRIKLANAAGITQVTVMHYLYADRSPNLEYVDRILKVFGKKIAIVDRD